MEWRTARASTSGVRFAAGSHVLRPRRNGPVGGGGVVSQQDHRGVGIGHANRGQRADPLFPGGQLQHQGVARARRDDLQCRFQSWRDADLEQRIGGQRPRRTSRDPSHSPRPTARGKRSRPCSSCPPAENARARRTDSNHRNPGLPATAITGGRMRPPAIQRGRITNSSMIARGGRLIASMAHAATSSGCNICSAPRPAAASADGRAGRC